VAKAKLLVLLFHDLKVVATIFNRIPAGVYPAHDACLQQAGQE
jgi:hypothetical protein